MKDIKLTGWKLNNEANASGTSLRGYICANYSELAKLFGEAENPNFFDGKVSTQWKFIIGNEVVTLYDYKETSLYSNDLPDVEEFRAQDFYNWHIGAHTITAAEHFALWLNQELKKQNHGE